MEVIWKRSGCIIQISIVIFLVMSCSNYGTYAANANTASPPVSASSLALFQQAYKSLSRALGEVLGFLSLILKSSVPPSTSDLIKKHGYPVENHYVRTDDNVILEIHRIPHGPLVEFFRLKKRIPVILFHGIAQSASDFLLNTPLKNSLGFFLSDQGYDVWLANLRGNLNKNSGQGNFTWEFSFHDMGVLDLPAIIQYVCIQTGFNRVHVVAYSMGNTALMAGLSKFRELNSKIKVAVILGPSVFHHNYYNGWLRLITKHLVSPGEILHYHGARGSAYSNLQIGGGDILLIRL